jgi:hypothetical protein
MFDRLERILGMPIFGLNHSFYKMKQNKFEPQVRYATITIRETTPANTTINQTDFIVVTFKRKHWWALFQCPCGCSEVITLSLQKVHQKHWSIRKSKFGRPTLSPSVARVSGCFSHFWIEDGRVYWCKKMNQFEEA